MKSASIASASGCTSGVYPGNTWHQVGIPDELFIMNIINNEYKSLLKQYDFIVLLLSPFCTLTSDESLYCTSFVIYKNCTTLLL